MQTTAEYQCAYCGEESTTFIDISAGYDQSYVEDCQVCCRPNLFFVSVDRDDLSVNVTTEYRE